ncbi:MAG TPA: hypothetical protein VK184_00125 [Nostocaceae cyanobacterium]|nr:hypothetical protein [Nostocaceae cyanobacterium]
MNSISTPNKRIIKQFIDYETGYLVVLEIRTDETTDDNVYCTLIDANTGRVISPEERISSIQPERIIVDEQHGLKLTILHTVDMLTGQETLHETLQEIATGRVKATRQSDPFSLEPSQSLIDIVLARQSEAENSSSFWEGEYSQMSLEEKKGYWLSNIMLQMRFQGESGLDEYSFFTPDNYAKWRAEEPDFDQILDFVIENIPDDTDEVRTEINRRLGRNL